MLFRSNFYFLIRLRKFELIDQNFKEMPFVAKSEIQRVFCILPDENLHINNSQKLLTDY